MAVFLALAAAVTWGTSDFLGGKTARNHSVLSVIAASQFIGLITLLFGAVIFTGSPDTGDMILGSAGSLAGAAGLMLLYWGLAHGQMSVVAPVTAVTGPLLPLIWGLASGEDLSLIAGGGVVLGLIAIYLISRSRDDQSHRFSVEKSILVALAAGALLGVFLVFLGNVGEDSGLWPLVAARLTSVPVMFAIALRTHTPILLKHDRGAIATVGVLDASANALVLLAFQAGRLTLGAVLSSLYPAATVVLARIVDREHFARVQIIGLFMGAVAIALIAAG